MHASAGRAAHPQLLSSSLRPGGSQTLTKQTGLHHHSTSFRRVQMHSVAYPPYLPNHPTSPTAPSLEQSYPHGILSMSKGTTIYEAMARLGDTFEEKPLAGPSRYVKPATLYYQFDGKERRWDIVEAMPSVGVVLYHTTLKAFLLVRQFRPPVYNQFARDAAAQGLPVPCKSKGFTYELCAGLVDKAKSLKQIACEEISEEVGYDVPVEALTELGSALASAGTSGAPHYVFFATVDESMRAPGAGGGLQMDGECIEVLALPLERCQAWAIDGVVNKSPGAMFGVMWGYWAVTTGQLGLSGNGTHGQNPNLTDELVLRPVLPS